MPQHQDDLEQSAVERRRLHVAHVALDAGYPQRRLAVDAAERLRDGVPLDAVAHHGAGCVGLDVVEVPRCAAGPGAGHAHEGHLCVTGGCGDVTPLGEAVGAVGRAGRIDRGRLDDGVNVVAVPLGRGERLDRKAERALRAHVAVGVGVEGVALAVRADDAQGIEGDAEPGPAQVVHGADESLLAIAALQRVHRRVQRGQAGGTGRAMGDRRPHQVEVVGDAVGQHRQADARNRELVDAAQRPPVGYRWNLPADEDSGCAVAQRMQVPAGAFEGLPGTRQHHPQLRIRCHHLVVRHSEEAPVEEPFFVLPDQSLKNDHDRRAPHPDVMKRGRLLPTDRGTLRCWLAGSVILQKRKRGSRRRSYSVEGFDPSPRKN